MRFLLVNFILQCLFVSIQGKVAITVLIDDVESTASLNNYVKLFRNIEHEVFVCTSYPVYRSTLLIENDSIRVIDLNNSKQEPLTAIPLDQYLNCMAKAGEIVFGEDPNTSILQLPVDTLDNLLDDEDMLDSIARVVTAVDVDIGCVNLLDAFEIVQNGNNFETISTRELFWYQCTTYERNNKEISETNVHAGSNTVSNKMLILHSSYGALLSNTMLSFAEQLIEHSEPNDVINYKSKSDVNLHWSILDMFTAVYGIEPVVVTVPNSKNSVNIETNEVKEDSKESSKYADSETDSDVQPHRVYDIFPFFDEFTLLRIRLELLQDVVDRFIVIEAIHTHTGQAKAESSYYNKNKHLLSNKILEKVTLLVVDLPHVPTANYNEIWNNERYQRDYLNVLLDNGIESAGELINFSDNDIVLISDADELIRPSAVRRASSIYTSLEYIIKHRLFDNTDPNRNFDALMEQYDQAYKLSVASFLYNFSTPMGNFYSRQPYLSTVSHLKQKYKQANDEAERPSSPSLISSASSLWSGFASKLRVGELEPPRIFQQHSNVIPMAGWHFSNFKSIKKIKYKLNSVAHQEFNSPIVRTSISDRVEQGLPTEFGWDRISNAHAAGNIFLQQKRRQLYWNELVDPELQFCWEKWNQYADIDDIAAGKRVEGDSGIISMSERIANRRNSHIEEPIADKDAVGEMRDSVKSDFTIPSTKPKNLKYNKSKSKNKNKKVRLNKSKKRGNERYS